MKKWILFIGAILLSTSVFAQNWQEVIYLKNGSAVRGIIIEQVPNETIKIQTADGSIFVYKFEDVEKITKEQKTTSESEKKKYPNRGYRSFLCVGIQEGSDIECISTSTIHGYQFFPKLYVGGGIGFQYVDYLDVLHFGDNAKRMDFLIFDYIRCDFAQRRISPFVDFRLGARFGDLLSIYYTPTIGCRFGHFNLSVGYEKMPYEYPSYSKYQINTETGSYDMLSVRIAFDMGAR